jgi:hypothetical protein
MQADLFSTIASARFLVGALGERTRWWPGRFTDATAQRSLQMVFPLTWERAAVESVSEAARTHHDNALAPKTFHLFRLPLHIEDRLAAWLARADIRLAWPPTPTDDLFAALQRLAGVEASSSSGPLCLGKASRLDRIATIQETVATYVHAARNDACVIPYFEE